MFVNEKRTWLQTVFAIRGCSISQTWPRIVAVTIFAAFVTSLKIGFGLQQYSLTPMPFTLMGLTLAIFLGFRNSAAYDRFWEGRKLWGSLVNTCRSLTRQTLTLIRSDVGSDADEIRMAHRTIVRAIIAYVKAFRHHLRGSEGDDEVRVYLDDEAWSAVSGPSNRPIAILQHLAELFNRQWREGRINDYHLALLENTLVDLTNVQGGCERIKNTPIPITYNVLIHRIVAGYCFAMPFGLVETTGILTPIAVGLISYGFFGLDIIGDDIEQPFEEDDNDLPLNAISRTIEIDLLEAIGETDIPAPVAAVKGVLN